jgi:hypothetical protein
VARSIGAHSRPGNFSQFFWWFPRFIPASRNVQILGIASICWAIWKLRNRACFEGKLINSPIDLICYATVFMKYWAGLNSDTDQDAIRRGANALIDMATGTQMGVLNSLMIEGGRSSHDNQDGADDSNPGRAGGETDDASR